MDVCHGSAQLSPAQLRCSGIEISVETWGLSDPTDWISFPRGRLVRYHFLSTDLFLFSIKGERRKEEILACALCCTVLCEFFGLADWQTGSFLSVE